MARILVMILCLAGCGKRVAAVAQDPEVEILSVSTAVLDATQTSRVSWRSSAAGSYLVLLGGDAAVIRRGQVEEAGAVMTSEIAGDELALGDNLIALTVLGDGAHSGRAETTLTRVPEEASGHVISGSAVNVKGVGLALRLNDAESLPVSGDGPFTFVTTFAEGASYHVAVETEPTSPEQTCVLSGASGLVGDGPVTDVAVLCLDHFSIGGTATGLRAGESADLLLGSEHLVVDQGGVFTFTTSVADGDAYAVTVSSVQASGGHTCVLDQGAGVVAGANVTSLLLRCLPPPRALFTDLASVPRRGGEGDAGAFVTIYGEGFGATRDDGRVTVGGVEVASYRVWGEDNAPARGLDMITVQLGAGVPLGTQPIVVEARGAPSAALDVIVTDAPNVRFADAVNGNDVTGDGSLANPWQKASKAAQAAPSHSVIHLRAGDYLPEGAAPAYVLDFDGVDCTADRALAFVAYPGEVPVFAGDNSAATAERGIDLNDGSACAGYAFAGITFSGLTSYAIALGGTNNRFVGNRLIATTDGGGEDTIRIQGVGAQVLGNLFDGVGAGASAVGARGGVETISDVRVAYNELRDVRGSAISLTCGDPGCVLDSIAVLANVIVSTSAAALRADIEGTCTLLPDPGCAATFSGLRFTNNIVLGSAREGLFVRAPVGTGAVTPPYVLAANNLFYGNDSANLAAHLGVDTREANVVELSNNSVVGDDLYNETWATGSGVAALGSHNLWGFVAGGAGADVAPGWDAAPLVHSDTEASAAWVAPPLLPILSTSLFDFHLATASLVAGAGTPVANVITDFDGAPRPNPPSIGPYEP